jgi:prephenate dehydrogenase
MKKIGIIGFGRFGRLLHDQLKSLLQIQVHDPVTMNDPSNSSMQFFDLETICKNELIILAIPVSQLETVCQNMKPHISKNSVIMDVCAVKTYPSGIMLKSFSSPVQLLGTHPLFGPDSVKENMRDHLMIMTPYRINDNNMKRIKKFWQNLGIKIIEMSADQQDRLMAWTLSMTHFLGRSLNGLPLPDTAIATRDYRNLIDLMRKINRDTWGLFEDMHRFNPYTKEMRKLLLESMQQMKEKLDEL